MAPQAAVAWADLQRFETNKKKAYFAQKVLRPTLRPATRVTLAYPPNFRGVPQVRRSPAYRAQFGALRHPAHSPEITSRCPPGIIPS
eukprot:1465805-Pyramimonas_sp.AAC.1